MSYKILPYEIISLIASHISTRDKLACTRVCKAWHFPFMKIMLFRVRIKEGRPLNAFIRFITSSPENITQYCPLVKIIHLRIQHDPQPKLIRWLQKHFQSIEKLDIDGGSLSSTCFGNNTYWKFWKSMTHLRLSLNGYNIYKNDFIAGLSCIPALIHLGLSQGGSKEKFICDLDDLEAIHSRLPVLEELVMCHAFKSLSKEDLPKVESTPKAYRMRAVRFEVSMVDLGWLYYWGCKYPNLAIIDCIAGFDQDKFDRYRDLGIESRPYVKHIFKCLYLAKLRADIERPQFQTAFINFISKTRAKISQFVYAPNHSEKGTLTNLSIVENDTQVFKNVSEFFLYLRKDTKLPAAFLGGLSYLSKLKKLTIESQQGLIPLHVVLDHCPTLKNLIIQGGTITYSKSDESSWKPHYLEKFEISYGTIQSQALFYLSTRCRQLFQVRLMYAKVQAPLKSSEREININMEHSRLKELLFHQVTFERLNRKDESTKENVFYVVVSQDNRAETLNKTQHDSTISVKDWSVSTGSKKNEKQMTDDIWLYFNVKKLAATTEGGSRFLKDDEKEKITSYFKAFRFNQGRAADIESTDRSSYAKEEREIRDTTFPRSYVRWKCAHIDRLYNGIERDARYPKYKEISL